MARLKREIEEVRRTRGLHRSARQRTPYPVIALIGYTNAGKSTLFNAMTGATVHAEDQLFATLDPTMRSIALPSGTPAILSDTVGFISDLPTELVAAFRATLEEVAEADVILHVRDIAHPDTAAQKADVLGVLGGMVKDGTLDPDWAERTIDVLNKADLLGGVAAVPGQVEGQTTIPISALSGEGLDTLRAAIDERLASAKEVASFQLVPSDGAKLAWLYRHGEVLTREDEEEAIHVTVRMLPADRARFESLV
jgi:GTP-binding protein HflX